MSNPSKADSISTKVVTKVAAAKGVSPMDMQPPLYDVVDPTALNNLFKGCNDTDRVGQVSFTYDGHDVTVKSNGQIDIETPKKRIPQSD